MNINNIIDNRKYFITDMVKFNKYKSYLELGIDNGKNISYVSNNTLIKCIGVDVKSPSVINGFVFHKGTTDDFFINNTDTFDVVFIDACHKVSFVKRDFINALKFLNKNGIILLHDVDPISIGFIDDKGANYSANAYKIVNWIYKNYPDLNVIVIPIDEAGIAVVNRKLDRRIYSYKGEKDV